MTVGLRRLGGPALGVLVFVAALGVWELWARAENSFLVPTASEVAEQAWEIWPTSEFLSDAAASLKRLAVGFAIAAAIGIAIGLLIGASRRARRTLEPFLEFTRAIPAIAIVPARSSYSASGTRRGSRSSRSALCFPILVNTAEGVRAIPPKCATPRRCCTSAGWSASGASTSQPRSPRSWPGCGSRCRSGSSSSSSRSSSARATDSDTRSSSSSRCSTSRRRTPASSSSACSGTSLNRLFLVVERRVLAWHYGAAGE